MDLLSNIALVLLDIGPKPPLELSDVLQMGLVQMSILYLLAFAAIPVSVLLFMLYRMRKWKEQKTAGIARFIVPLLTLVVGIWDLLLALTCVMPPPLYYPYSYALPVLRIIGVLFLVGGLTLVLGSIYVMYKRLKR